MSKRLLCIALGILGIIAILGIGTLVVQTMDKQGAFGVVVIDPGHGGYDGGVCVGDIKESVINLELSRMLAKELESRNIKAVLTRTGEEALGNTKKKDMAKRSEIINKTKPEMVISMHVNKWSGESRRGVQVFYDDTKKNAALAEYMQSGINTHVNSKYSKRISLKSLGGDYFITKCSPYPTVIIENGFISNAEDRKLLISSEYRQDIVTTVSNMVEALIASHEQN